MKPSLKYLAEFTSARQLVVANGPAAYGPGRRNANGPGRRNAKREKREAVKRRRKKLTNKAVISRHGHPLVPRLDPVAEIHVLVILERAGRRKGRGLDLGNLVLVGVGAARAAQLLCLLPPLGRLARLCLDVLALVFHLKRALGLCVLGGLGPAALPGARRHCVPCAVCRVPCACRASRFAVCPPCRDAAMPRGRVREESRGESYARQRGPGASRSRVMTMLSLASVVSSCVMFFSLDPFPAEMEGSRRATKKACRPDCDLIVDKGENRTRRHRVSWSKTREGNSRSECARNPRPSSYAMQWRRGDSETAAIDC